MSISLRGKAGILLTGVVLLVATLLVLPGVAEAQGTASTEYNTPNTNQNTGATSPMGSPAGTAEGTNDLSAEGVRDEGATPLAVKPGDTLWSIARERLHPDATPEQVGNEVERIVELNLNSGWNNPNLILPGQELLVAPVAEPAAVPASSEPSAAEDVVAIEPMAKTVNPFTEPNNDQRRLIGLGILVVTFVLAGLIVAWRPSMEREIKWKILAEYSANYALATDFELTKAQADRHQDYLNPDGSSAASKTKLLERTMTPSIFERQKRRRKGEVEPRVLRTSNAKRTLRRVAHQQAATGVHSPQARRFLTKARVQRQRLRATTPR